MILFVPQNFGLDAITREEHIRLYNRDGAREAIAYFDGLYCYIEKSSNLQALWLSYWLHKGRPFVKPPLIVAPGG